MIFLSFTKMRGTGVSQSRSLHQLLEVQPPDTVSTLRAISIHLTTQEEKSYGRVNRIRYEWKLFAERPRKFLRRAARIQVGLQQKLCRHAIAASPPPFVRQASGKQ